jgi:hypothetical protein
MPIRYPTSTAEIRMVVVKLTISGNRLNSVISEFPRQLVRNTVGVWAEHIRPRPLGCLEAVLVFNLEFSVARILLAHICSHSVTLQNEARKNNQQIQTRIRIEDEIIGCD